MTKTFDCDVESMGDFTFSTINPQEYTGGQLRPSVTVYYQGSTPLSVGTDYELHYFDNVNVGRAFVVAIGKSGTTVADKAGVTMFTINSKSINKSMLTAIGTQTYTGSPIEPDITLAGLTQGTDFTVSYADNTNVGTATATITAIGNYSGELETTFEIQKATPVITMSTDAMTLRPGETDDTRTATTTFGTVTYSSSDENVATVDADGKVTAVADGEATITANVAADVNGNWNADSKSYTVTVSSRPAIEAVDLGLSVKWANMNVGAWSESDYGDYFAWGETEPYYSSQDPLTWKTDKGKGYSWDSYKFGSPGSFTKYNSSDGKTELDPEDDAAHVNWGDGWRMPTYTELNQLLSTYNNTTDYSWEWTTVSGHEGWKITSKKSGTLGNSIFLPAAGGYLGGTTITRYGNWSSSSLLGYYWTKSVEGNSYYSNFLYFHSGLTTVNYYNRYQGLSVRPVQSN